MEEYTFKFDNFDQPLIETDLRAYAIRIQRLLLPRVGMMPNNADVSVDIRSFFSEVANNDTFTEMQDRLYRIIRDREPSIPLERVIIEIEKAESSDSGKRIINIGIVINSFDGTENTILFEMASSAAKSLVEMSNIFIG